MTTVQFFVLMSVVYLSPHMGKVVGQVLGIVFLFAAVFEIVAGKS